jgi:alpha-1,2-mannosyltransferase
MAALVGAAYLAYRRYHALEGVDPRSPRGVGGDFWFFLDGARQLSRGHTLYDLARVPKGFYGYVYTPLIALVLLPFSHAGNAHIFHVWTALSIAALVAFGALVLVSAPRLSSWRLPLLFGITALSALEFVPTKVEFSQGQVDAFILVLFALAVLASERGFTAVSGALTGLGGLVKTWPAAGGLAFAQRGYVRRTRAVVAFVATLVIGPLLAFALGGGSELAGFFRTTFDSRSQHLVSHSVWGTPLLLFLNSGLAKPLFASFVVRDFATVVLVLWVIALLVLVLSRAGSPVLCFWHVVGCVVLLVPVSHSEYTMYLLPLLWIWWARWLTEARSSGVAFVVAGALALWWLVLFHVTWSPTANGSPTASSLRISVMFFANLAAVTVSVWGDRLWARSPAYVGLATGAVTGT